MKKDRAGSRRKERVRRFIVVASFDSCPYPIDVSMYRQPILVTDRLARIAISIHRIPVHRANRRNGGSADPPSGFIGTPGITLALVLLQACYYPNGNNYYYDDYPVYKVYQVLSNCPFICRHLVVRSLVYCLLL